MPAFCLHDKKSHAEHKADKYILSQQLEAA